ncbi:MAG: outer membrane lipoprotein-sorting protein [FCB group bacterium]|nr:outer membrane lipoprotein-sorting protein [FCB group bacterium]
MRNPFMILFLIGFLFAQNQTGYEIMSRALNKKSWDDMKADLSLEMVNARGETRSRTIAFYSSNDKQDLNRMLMRFLAPADVRGTGFLTLETASGDEERYLYLPALRRVKKIAASGSGGNFMSSDFTYYDIDWKTKIGGLEISAPGRRNRS